MIRFNRKLTYLLLAIPLGCASVQTIDNDDGSSGAGSGGKPGSGGSKAGGSGGRASGGTSHSGGTSSSGGVHAAGAGSDGGTSSGGKGSGAATSSGGALSSGGQSSSGGAGTGGGWVGDCQDKPAWSAWKAGPSPMSGDLVIHACTKNQSECQNLEVGVDSLFECTDSHVNNCTTQRPEDGSAWTFRGECADLIPMGGASGMAGAEP